MAPKRKRAAWQRPTCKESSFTDCPACQMKVVSHLINEHLDWDCLALVQSTERPIMIKVAETANVLSKSPEGIAEADVKLPVNKAEAAELNDHCLVRIADAEDEGSLILVPPDKNFYSQGIRTLEKNPQEISSQGIRTLEKNPQEISSQKSTAFKLNALSCNEFSLNIHNGQPDAKPQLKLNTEFYHEKDKSSVFPTTTTLSNAELEDDNADHNLEIHEHIPRHCEGLLDLGRIESSAGASILSPKSARKDGWEFITASLPAKVPKGHYVIENFITEKEEQEIVSFLDMDTKNPWKVKTFNGTHVGKAYGLSPDLKQRRIGPAAFEMPEILVPVFERMRLTVPILKDFWPNETNAIEYCKHRGHWLKPHVDDRQLSGTILVNLSLCGDCKMTYNRERGPREPYKILLCRRSIQIQTGDCRYNFTHSILNDDLLAPRRLSMTFRQSVIS